MKICVIIPTLNEEKNISKIVDKIKKTKIKLYILFIDDRSTDNSQKIIRKLTFMVSRENLKITSLKVLI